MMYDTRGTELGWLVAQVIPWLRAVTSAKDSILYDRGMGPLFTGLQGSVAEGKLIDFVPDMIGPGLRKLVKIGTKAGVPVLLAKKKVNGHSYGKVMLGAPTIALHCRGISKCPERNWDHANWDELVEGLNYDGHEVVILGTKDDYCPAGRVLDRRGRDLLNTACYMRSALVVVGASSGPMHLAQLSTAPVVTWSGNWRKDRPRYTNIWNLFDSPTLFASPTWDPPVDTVYRAIRDILIPF